LVPNMGAMPTMDSCRGRAKSKSTHTMPMRGSAARGWRSSAAKGIDARSSAAMFSLSRWRRMRGGITAMAVWSRRKRNTWGRRCGRRGHEREGRERRMA